MTITDFGIVLNGVKQLSGPAKEDVERLLPTIRTNLARDLPELQEVLKHNTEISIVATGPNLEDAFHLYTHQQIMCVNEAHDWLIERGVIPDFCVFLDNNPRMVDVIKKPHPNVKYLCASMTSPELLDKLVGYHVTLWHALQGCGEEQALTKDSILIGGGSNVGQRAISVAHFLGYRTINCFGLCGCILDGKDYVYESDTPNELFNITFNGNTFQGTLEHSMQAGSFWKVLEYHRDTAIIAHGRGLLPKMAEAFWNKRNDER